MEYYTIPTRLPYDICCICVTMSSVLEIFGLENVKIWSVQTRVEPWFGDDWWICNFLRRLKLSNMKIFRYLSFKFEIKKN